MIGKILRRLRRSRRATTPRPAILMYHRVVSVEQDPWALCVTPEHFDEQMQFLAQHRVPMFVDEMVARIKDGTLPRLAVGITFDDAYRDNLVNAKPILTRHKVPATVFVPTGLIGQALPFWWDELSTMVFTHPGPVRFVQRCGKDDVVVDWDAPEAADKDPEWRGWDPPRSKRQHAYVALWSRMQRMSEGDRHHVLTELRQRFYAPSSPLAEPMTRAELTELIDNGLIRLGAHTVTHASLSDVSLDESRRELQESKAQCSTFTNIPVDGFAYPYGNLTEDVRKEVELAGYAWACSTDPYSFEPNQVDLYRLPRLTAPDVSGPAFTQLLSS